LFSKDFPKYRISNNLQIAVRSLGSRYHAYFNLWVSRWKEPPLISQVANRHWITKFFRKHGQRSSKPAA
jgi:hypothetical protein